MLRFFRKRPKSPEDDLRDTLLYSFSELQEASKKSGIERDFHISTLFGTLVENIRLYFPNVPIEKDSPAMVILSSGADNSNFDNIRDEISYVVQQVSDCPNSNDLRVIIMRGLLSPDYFQKTFNKVEAGNHQG